MDKKGNIDRKIKDTQRENNEEQQRKPRSKNKGNAKGKQTGTTKYLNI